MQSSESRGKVGGRKGEIRDVKNIKVAEKQKKTGWQSNALTCFFWIEDLSDKPQYVLMAC